MMKRQTPPARKSNVCVVSEKPFGPHQCARCFGSVQASNTRLRGASNTRLPEITFGSSVRSRRNVSAMGRLLRLHHSDWDRLKCVDVALSLRGLAPLRSRARLLLLCLQRLEVGIEPVEALLPKAAVLLEPAVDLLQRLEFDPARTPLALPTAPDQACRLQHLQVLGDGRQAH